jgi:hypothetical protein
MSLYKAINNEALDEDLAIQRSVLERLKASVKDIKEKVQPLITLDGVQKNILSRNFAIYERQLYKLTGYLEQQDVSAGGVISQAEVADQISKIVLAYNNLVIFINSLNPDKLADGDKQKINTKFSDSIALLNIIKKRLESKVDDQMLAPISKIIDNITINNNTAVSYGLQDIAKELERKSQNRQIQLEQKRLARIYKTNSLITKTDVANLSKPVSLKLANQLTGDIYTSKADSTKDLQDGLDTYRDLSKQLGLQP